MFRQNTMSDLKIWVDRTDRTILREGGSGVKWNQCLRS